MPGQALLPVTGFGATGITGNVSDLIPGEYVRRSLCHVPPKHAAFKRLGDRPIEDEASADRVAQLLPGAVALILVPERDPDGVRHHESRAIRSSGYGLCIEMPVWDVIVLRAVELGAGGSGGENWRQDHKQQGASLNSSHSVHPPSRGIFPHSSTEGSPGRVSRTKS